MYFSSDRVMDECLDATDGDVPWDGEDAGDSCQLILKGLLLFLSPEAEKGEEGGGVEIEEDGVEQPFGHEEVPSPDDGSFIASDGVNEFTVSQVLSHQVRGHPPLHREVEVMGDVEVSPIDGPQNVFLSGMECSEEQGDPDDVSAPDDVDGRESGLRPRQDAIWMGECFGHLPS